MGNDAHSLMNMGGGGVAVINITSYMINWSLSRAATCIEKVLLIADWLSSSSYDAALLPPPTFVSGCASLVLQVEVYPLLTEDACHNVKTCQGQFILEYRAARHGNRFTEMELFKLLEW
ncbi:hypothetical protein J6590_053309 [Homalodisca vitripennis]|nr:hypothetical protein J6590_053309 [Homalodisca vitripennis]